MKKILIIFNNDLDSRHLVDFALMLAAFNSAKINGIFLSSDAVTNADDGPVDENSFENIKLFNESCKDTPHHVQILVENYLDIITDETAFADLVICDDDMKIRNFSMHSFIASSHCPVLLIPQNVSPLQHIVFAYDGLLSSIHAMKQFTYLLPMFKDTQVYLVSVVPDNIMKMEYDILAREWIKLHYTNSEVIILKGNIGQEMINFINQKKDCLVVMGAFGRSALSRFFKESLAPLILSGTQAPVFIAHS